MKKLLSTTIAVGIFTSMSISPVLADVAAGTLPSLNNATNATVTTNKANMNIQINGGQGSVGTLNWNSYNVGKDASVNYEFTAHNQTALNKVSSAGGLSQIYGKITDSGCFNCGYEGTGKIILINPNGVLFGDGANVNVNSFTASTMNGVYDAKNNKLTLTKDANQKDFGIVVLDGAKIHGDKNVTFASKNITTYNGSQISTNTLPNVGNTAYGKVKLVTADGVTFNYYNNGAVKGISDIKTSADKMTLAVNGDITSGNIDIRNYSTHDGSEVNLKGATLKATKAINGNDGNIWLTAANKVVVEDSNFKTANAAGAENVAGGDLVILAGKKVSVGSSNVDVVGNVKMTSQGHDIVVDKTKITTPKDVILTAGNISSIQNGSEVNANNVTLKGTERAQIASSNVKANGDVNLTANNVWFNHSNVKAKNINAKAEKGWALANASTMEAAKITIDAATNVTGDIDVKDSQTNIYAGKDIDVTLKNVGNRNNGLVAEAGQNVKITTPGTLSVSRLVAKNGDMTINADKVIAGLPYTSEAKIPGDNSERSYIYVKHGKFTSNTANDSFEVTASDTITADGKFKERHHIQYGDGAEKILLINDRPFVTPVEPTPDPEPQPSISVNDDQAKMLNKIPRQPEVFNNKTNIHDGRTSFVDVFAAASQIEIEDDEE